MFHGLSCILSVLFEQALYVLAKDDEYMIVLTSTDELLCFYRESSTFHKLLVHMCKCLRCTSQEVPVLKFINLWIVQYKHAIIFDQTSHIKQTSVGVWLPKPTDPLGMRDTTFWTYTTYVQYLVDILAIPPKDIPGVDNKYVGLRFNAQIGKYPHVEDC